jgi:hypothetical protein
LIASSIARNSAKFTFWLTCFPFSGEKTLTGRVQMLAVHRRQSAEAESMQAQAQVAAVAAAVAAVACLGIALFRSGFMFGRKRRTQTDAAYVALIGSTPMVQLARLSRVLGREIWVKVSASLLHVWVLLLCLICCLLCGVLARWRA